ncbi:MAG: alpha/beta fold hydrolase [Betaproteobacteria bacterium]
MVPRLHTFALLLAAATALAGCGSDVARKRSVALAECRLPNLATAAQCGELEVPENRAQPAGRKLKLFVAVLPANTVSPKEDPLVILAGGPGQAASSLAPFAARLGDIRRTRDIVLIDQRGTGRSSPLVCDAFKPQDDDAFDTDPGPRAKACVAQLRAQGVDLAQYTTAAWIQDLDAMREALGYDRWNLWGGSYGTRVAQEYTRQHPQHVRTMTLDGIAPPALIITLDVWRTRAAALEAIFNACSASKACHAAHPDPQSLLARVAADLGPSGRDVEFVDPRTGAPEKLHATMDAVLAALQPLTYLPEMATLMPELLSLAAQGHYGPLLAANIALSGNLNDAMNAALHFSVTCTEDVPRIKAGEALRALDALPVRSLAQRSIAVCEFWPRGAASATLSTPLQSAIPSLLISGGMDPVTPPAYGDIVARGLTNSRHVIAPGFGHIVTPHACGPRLLAAFVDTADPDKLPPSCVTYFEKSVPPMVWSGRLEPRP